MRGNVFVFQPGELRVIHHREDFGDHGVEGMETDLALDSAAIEDHFIAHLVAEFAGSFLPDNLADDFAGNGFVFCHAKLLVLEREGG
jgi:hypothetical protein